jgi:hypothetical protein
MLNNIPRYSELINPLQQVLIQCTQKVQSLKKFQLRRVKLNKENGWDETHRSRYVDVQ